MRETRQAGLLLHSLQLKDTPLWYVRKMPLNCFDTNRSEHCLKQEQMPEYVISKVSPALIMP